MRIFSCHYGYYNPHNVIRLHLSVNPSFLLIIHSALHPQFSLKLSPKLKQITITYLTYLDLAIPFPLVRNPT